MKHRIINTYHYIETLLAKQYIVFCIISENVLCLLSGHRWATRSLTFQVGQG